MSVAKVLFSLLRNAKNFQDVLNAFKIKYFKGVVSTYYTDDKKNYAVLFVEIHLFSGHFCYIFEKKHIPFKIQFIDSEFLLREHNK